MVLMQSLASLCMRLPTQLTSMRCLTGILVGCVLTAWLSVSASGQELAPKTAAADASPESGAQLVRDAWEAHRSTGNGITAVAPATAERPADTRAFAQQYVNAKLALWQQRLKLNDWHMTWAMARRCDLKTNTVGQIQWDKNKKSAAILVLDPSDYQMPFNAMLGDMELTIIHELVHLKLTSLPHSEASRGGEEHAVNGISEALFALENQPH